MANQEVSHVNSHRMGRLAKKLENKEYRSAYVSAHLRTFLANQIKSLRGELSQSEFGRLLEKPQSVVSRLEDPHYGKLTLQTLLEVSAKMDVALLVRFVDYGTFLKLTDDFSSDALSPEPYGKEQIDFQMSQYNLGINTFRAGSATNGRSLRTEILANPRYTNGTSSEQIFT